MATYIPGVCNIGEEEIKLRNQAGWMFLIVTVIFGAFFYFLPGISPWLRLVIFFPAAISALGFLQAAFHFCVAFGTQGLFNVDHEAGKTESVSQAVFRKQDQRKAVLIIIYSLIIAAIVAAVAFYL
jgi:hypothetical protein